MSGRSGAHARGDLLAIVVPKGYSYLRDDGIAVVAVGAIGP